MEANQRNLCPDEPAIRGLGVLGSKAAAAVPDLIEIVQDWRSEYHKDENRPPAAIETLGRIGPPARAALPLLREMAQNPLFHDESVVAIRRIVTGRQ